MNVSRYLVGNLPTYEDHSVRGEFCKNIPRYLFVIDHLAGRINLKFIILPFLG